MVFGLFKAKPLNDKKIAKISKLACNPFAQSDVRFRELERLLQEGSEAAIFGAIKRFDANASGHIADEEEKAWLEKALVDVGEAAISPLKRFIDSGKQLSYALRAFRVISGVSGVTFILNVLDKHGPDAYQTVEAKLQLVQALSEETQLPDVLPRLVPYVLDHSDDIKWEVIALFEGAAKAGELAEETRLAVVEALSQILFANDLGPRLQRRAAECLADREWMALGDSEMLPELIAEDFFIDKKRYIRRRVAH